MKKRFTLFLIACLVCMLVCACGGGSQSSDTADSSGGETASSETQDGSEVIDVGEKVIIDDENVTIAVSQFYSVEYTDATRSYVSFKVTNKSSENKIYVESEAVYVGDEEAKSARFDSSGNVLPGKSATIDYEIYKQSAGQDTPIAPLDELYGLNGELSVDVIDGNDDTHLISTQNYLYDLNDIK